MRTNIVFTLTGTDRIGIVEEVTKSLLDIGGNIETSRMARLGGEFAIILLVTLPTGKIPDLDKVSARLTGDGFKVTTIRTKQQHPEAHPDWRSCHISVVGADHEGIIYTVAHDLSQRGVNIESMDTETTLAPVSGTPLFSMKARITVPPTLPDDEWQKDLTALGHSLNVEISFAAAAEE